MLFLIDSVSHTFHQETR